MSGLSKDERARLSDDDFADGTNRTMVLHDAEDLKRALFRSNVMAEPARTQVRRRIVEVALKKKLRIPPSLAIEEIRREIDDYNARQGRQAEGDSTNGNMLRFTIRNEEELTHACATAREKLNGKGESMNTNFQQRHDTDAGRMVLQRIHDEAARAGAVCVAPKNLSASAEFISKHESAKIQEAHDLAVSGGARCNQQGASPYFSGSQPTLRDPKERARAHVEKRNKLIRGESGAATTQAELSEPEPNGDPMEAARERARATARRHVERRNKKIEQEKQDIKDGKRPFWWRGR